MKKGLIMSLVAILVACVGAVIALVSVTQRRKCHCDDCCCDDDLEFFDEYEDSLDEKKLEDKSDFEVENEKSKKEKE